jgi:phenylalanyl-tRNA synthetase beta chain
MRPINNIVDITNFVMLEYGQPLHSFNYDKISNNQIIVRKAKSGETITTLDGIYRPLSENILVIADAEKPIAIAGIMGGFESEVEEDTTNILLEAANFSRSAIRRGNRQLGLKSEASLRFDKGLSADLSLPALKRATQLLQELADGKVAKGIADEYPGKVTHEEVTITEEELKRITGMEIKNNQIIKTLTSLGFECRQAERTLINVKPPYWRTDIRYPADLIEEVVRIIGYDSIPTTRLSSHLPKQELLPVRSFRNKIGELLINTGFQEVLTYSLTSLQKIESTYGDDNSKISPLKVVNPMTSEQEYLRTSLRSSMLSTIANNQKYESGGIKIFEIGKVFIPSNEISTKKRLPHEKEMLCIVLSGIREETGWQNSKQNINFYDAKGVVEKILSNWHLVATYVESNDNCLYPGRGTDIIIDDSKIGMLGEIHPKVAQYFEIASEKSTFMIEIDLERLRSLALVNEGRKFHEIAKYPEITRDISIIVDNEIRYYSVEEIVSEFALIKNLVLFDLYTGKQIPEGKKSFALRLTYQSNDHTLTNEEVDKIENRVLEIMNDKLGAVLRS